MESTKSGPNRVIIVSVVREGNNFRVSLDDATRASGQPMMWRQVEHVTNKVVPAANVENAQFSEEELVSFGHYIFARLSAFVGRGEN